MWCGKIFYWTLFAKSGWRKASWTHSLFIKELKTFNINQIVLTFNFKILQKLKKRGRTIKIKNVSCHPLQKKFLEPLNLFKM